jgi:ubiquinone/menaquinone biosynthesis C-methylase UbiE
MSYEPSKMEIYLTLGIGGIIAPFYRSYVNSLPLQEDEKVLDFGSGSGILSRHIAARLERGGGQLTCVDISARWMKIIQRTLRRYNNVTLRLGHITQVDLPDASFDTVLIHFVLHDIPAAERPLIMQTLARKLKPGGRLILREPQGHGLDMPETEALTSAAGLVSQDFEAHKVWLGPVIDGIFHKADLLQTDSPEIRHSSDVFSTNHTYTFDQS